MCVCIDDVRGYRFFDFGQRPAARNTHPSQKIKQQQQQQQEKINIIFLYIL